MTGDRERRDEPPEFEGHVPTSVRQKHEELKKTEAERREAEARADLAESVVEDYESCNDHGLVYDTSVTEECPMCDMIQDMDAQRVRT